MPAFPDERIHFDGRGILVGFLGFQVDSSVPAFRGTWHSEEQGTLSRSMLAGLISVASCSDCTLGQRWWNESDETGPYGPSQGDSPFLESEIVEVGT